MHRREVWTITALLLLAVFASAQKIVVTFPAYDIVLKEAFPNADVILLTKGVSDPHEYQLTPQDLQMLKALTERDVIISSMHAPFELKIAEMAKRRRNKSQVDRPNQDTVVPHVGRRAGQRSRTRPRGA
jgi:zinc/manganese transport system substrate-binding protein